MLQPLCQRSWGQLKILLLSSQADMLRVSWYSCLVLSTSIRTLKFFYHAFHSFFRITSSALIIYIFSSYVLTLQEQAGSLGRSGGLSSHGLLWFSLKMILLVFISNVYLFFGYTIMFCLPFNSSSSSMIGRIILHEFNIVIGKNLLVTELTCKLYWC